MIDHFTLIIGAPKCGTTSLFRYLSEHPEISPCRVKEPNFFGQPEIWEKGLDWYQQLWEWNSSHHRTALEATPLYTSVDAYQRMRQINTQFKFIYMIRNPIQRIESQYIFSYYQGRIDGSESLDMSPGQIAESRLQRYIDMSRYAEKIDEFRQFFPLTSLCVIQLEELQNDPLDVLKRVCQFLEVDDTYSFQTAGQVFNPKESHDPLWQWLRTIAPLRAVAQRFPGSFKHQLRQLLMHRPVRNQVKPQPLTESQKAFILHSLQDDRMRLQATYGIDTGCWNLPLGLQDAGEEPRRRGDTPTPSVTH